MLVTYLLTLEASADDEMVQLEASADDDMVQKAALSTPHAHERRVRSAGELPSSMPAIKCITQTIRPQLGASLFLPAVLQAPRMPASDLASGPSDCSDVKISGSLQEVLRYTRRHLMRVYPAGWRVDSSNYNPMIAWARGASLAALNWQSWGKPLWLNQALVGGAWVGG